MEWPFRQLIKILLSVLGVAMVLFHLISVRWPIQTFGRYLVSHLGFALTLVFLNSLKERNKFWLWTLGLLVAGITVTAYIEINYQELALRGFEPTTTEVIVGSVLILLVLEGVRYAMGKVMTAVGVGLLIYLLFGYILPPPFQSMRYFPDKIIADLSIAVPGMYGKFVKVSANYLFLFVIFAAVLQRVGGNEFFKEFGKLIGGGFRMGAALTAIAGSSLVGMVTGIPGANVAITGSFTIPLMKSSGYSPEQAGAIEAAASNGGHIMPPVMGIAAFLMAELIGVPFVEIMKSAFIPAILYYATLVLYAHLQATRMNVRPIVEPVDYKILAINAPLFVVPLGMIVGLLLMGFSVAFAAFWAVISSIFLSMIFKREARTWKVWVEAFTAGALLGARLAVTCALLGMLAATVIKTGLGMRLPALVETLSGGNFFIGLLLVAATALFLGLGVSTSAAYLLVAIMAAPVLIKMGVSIFSAHFFVFYFACFSVLTPPVGPAAITASIIAQASYFKTGVESIKAAMAGFILPFTFIFCPLILIQPGKSPFQELIHLIIIIVSIISAQAAIAVYWITGLNPMERTLFFLCSGILLLSVPMQSTVLVAVGLTLFFGLTAIQIRRKMAMTLLKSME